MFSLLLNNSRGPWLALIAGIGIYIAVYNRRVIIPVLFAAILITVGANKFQPKHYNNFIKKVSSISNTETNYSNIGRLIMWKKATEFTIHNIKEDKRTFLFGTGVRNLEEVYGSYIKESGIYEEVKAESKNTFSLSDHHSIYLNILSQMGIIYFLAFWGYLAYLLYSYFIMSIKTMDSTLIGVVLSSAGFLICGVFYSYIFDYEMFTYFMLLYFGIYTSEKYSSDKAVGKILVI